MVDARSVTNRIEDGSDTFISVHDQMSCYGCRDSRSVIRRSVTGSPAKPRSQRSPPRPRWVPQKQHETGICGPANERCWCAPGACLRQWEDAKKGLVGGGARRPAQGVLVHPLHPGSWVSREHATYDIFKTYVQDRAPHAALAVQLMERAERRATQPAGKLPDSQSFAHDLRFQIAALFDRDREHQFFAAVAAVGSG